MIISVEMMDILKKIKNSFFEDLKIEFLFHSNHLEGSTFSKKQLELLISSKTVDGNHPLDDVYETRNSLDVFDAVIDSLGQPLDKYLLWDWHRTLKKNSVDEEIHNAGCWKKYENRLRGIDLRLAYPQEVDSLMFNLLMDWEESDKTMEDIVRFHARFEKIHPFQDGNGRIGRFIILKQCIEAEIDLIAIDGQFEDEYKKALYSAQKNEEYQELINVFEKCQLLLNNKLKNYSSLIAQIKKD